MKQKDILLTVVIGIVSAVFSLVFSNATIGSPKNRAQTAEVVDKISDEFQVPSDKYFNNDSIDPTRIIRVGEDSGATAPEQAKPVE